MSSRNAPKPKIAEMWGLVSERLAADPKLVEAVTFVLGWEQDRVSVSHIPGVPSDIAYPEVCNRLGEVEGLGRAIMALTDHAYIAQQRDLINDKIKEMNDDARRDRDQA